jgi:hypothetical protein
VRYFPQVEVIGGPPVRAAAPAGQEGGVAEQAV